MAKRNTVGGPRQRKRTAEDIERREAYLSKAERERLFQQRILIGVALIGIVTIVILAGALLYDNVVLPRESLAVVEGEEIDVNTFQERVKYDRFQNAQFIEAYYEFLVENTELSREEAEEYLTSQQSPQQIQQALNTLLNTTVHAGQVLDQMEREKVVEQKVEEFGLDIDEDAVEAQISDMIVNFTGRSITPTPSATPSLEPSVTPTPLVSATPSPEPSETPIPTETIQPTAEGCEEGDEECPTVTPLPTLIPSETPTVTPEVSETPTPTETATPTLEPDAVEGTVVAFREDFFEEGSDVSGLNEEAIRSIFYAQAQHKALRDFVTSQLDNPLYADFYVNEDDIWVHARHILIAFPQDQATGTTTAPPEGDDNEYYREALAVKEALEAGSPFAAVAEVNSDDPGSGANGGDLSWSSSSGYVEGFKEAVETLPIGAYSDPVRSEFGYHVIQVMDRETREYGPGQLESLREQEFTEWLDVQMLEVRIERREGWEELIPDDPTFEDLLKDTLPNMVEQITGGDQ